MIGKPLDLTRFVIPIFIILFLFVGVQWLLCWAEPDAGHQEIGVRAGDSQPAGLLRKSINQSVLLAAKKY